MDSLLRSKLEALAVQCETIPELHESYRTDFERGENSKSKKIAKKLRAILAEPEASPWQPIGCVRRRRAAMGEYVIATTGVCCPQCDEQVYVGVEILVGSGRPVWNAAACGKCGHAFEVSGHADIDIRESGNG